MATLSAGASLLAAATAWAQAEPPPPILPDDAFEAELPPLDPALGQPLESIDEFEATLPDVVPPATPAPQTAPTPETPSDPAADPALAEPLPPIATFDTTPTQVGPEEGEEAPPVRYTLVVEGLDAVDLEGRFRSLSALDKGDGEATNGAVIAARAREDETLAVRLLRAEGYYDGTAIVSTEQLPDQPNRLRITIAVAPGERYNLGAIALTGPETVPPGLAREALTLKTGDPIVAAAVEAAEANVAIRLPQQGYPFASVGQRDVLLDPATHVGDYTLPFDTGPRASFGGFTTEGDLAFDAEHVGVLARFDRGQLYDSRLVDDLREAMVATNLFSSVAAEPVRTGEVGPDGTEYVNIRVRQDAGPARALTATAGYGTGEGFRVEGAWEHRNLFPPEGSLRAAAVAGTQEQSAGLTFRRANAGKRDRTVVLSAEAGRRDYPAYVGYTARIGGLISRESTPIWQKRWTWNYGAEVLATNENTFDPGTASRDRQTYFIGGVTGQLNYDATNSLLDPTRGFRLSGRLNPEVSLGDGTRPYLRSIVEGSVYYPATDALVVAGRARFGAINGIGRDDLAPSRRLYAGGGGSVRGFGYQELGPRVAELNDKGETVFRPIGGRGLTEFALEGRYRFGDYGVVAFVDAGQVTESQYPSVSDLRYGVGVGGRLYTNFGPMRVDIAMPLDRQPGESRFALYVSIGQAF